MAARQGLLLIAALFQVVSVQSYMSRYSCNSTESILQSQGLTEDTFFCAPYVNYTSACDLDDDPALGFNPSCNNSFAIQIYANFERALSVYSCKEYSRIWTCDNCTVAYKRWLCSALFRMCDPNLPCPSNFTRTNEKAIPDCVVKTCQDVCYDVVRKCPVHLEFRCPPVNDLREYDVKECNNLERPSTSAGNALVSSATILAALALAVTWLQDRAFSRA
mmetsp:Transcript_8333/g.16663  ORF Transcript_8333/g.16663 Transcript_8333/m.16663 type:complete len:219 (+) Transcript_8333:37-693(+)